MEKLRLYPSVNTQMIDASVYASHTRSIDIIDCGYNRKGELVTYVCVLNNKDGSSTLCDTHRDDEQDDLWQELLFFWSPDPVNDSKMEHNNE